MARVISGVLQPTTTTPGQPIAHFTPDVGTELLATQCSGWMKATPATAIRMGVVGFYEDSECKLELAFHGCTDYGWGASFVVPLEGITVQSGGQEYSWAFVPTTTRGIAGISEVMNLAVLNTFWHAAFFYQ